MVTTISSRRRLFFEELDSRRLLSVTPGTNLSTGTALTTYRFALATTAELTAQLGGVAATSTVLDQIVADVNDVFMRELAIRLELVSNNDSLLFTNAATDGYTNGDAFTMATENPGVLNNAIGSSDYDVGHVLGTTASAGASGVGFLPLPGQTPIAKGGSLISGVEFARDILVHEIAHTLGAEHTFNGAAGNCSGQREADTSYEPGSGSTIMAYQGICGTDDLPAEPGDGSYYHAASFEQIIEYLNSIAAGTTVSTGNTIPVVSAGPDFTIPAFTPFQLTATVNDPDVQDDITFAWEQIDADPDFTGQNVPIPNAQDAEGPLFRSFAPSPDATRVFPRLEDLLSNTPQATNLNEHLPTQSRTMNFRVTARDNHSTVVNASTHIVSGVASDDTVVTVVDTGSAFSVSSPNTAVTWTGGTNETITWNVGGTDAHGINVGNVRILLSTDGGQTFPFVLATTANNGSHSLTVPNIDTTSARLKIEAEGNIFFDLSDEDFTVQSNSTLAGVTITESSGNTMVSESGATDTYDVQLNTVPTAGTVTIGVSADAESVVSLDGVHFASSQTLVFSSTNSQTVTVRAIDDQNDDGPGESTLQHEVTASNSSEYPVGMLIDQVVATVVDNEIPPLVAVDYDYDCCGSQTPKYWSMTNFLHHDVTDLTFDHGVPSSIDLIASPDPGSFSLWVITGSPLSSTVPKHLPSLYGVDGSSSINTGITLTFDGLTPGMEYSVFAFGFDVDPNRSFSQTVTISGESSLPTFTQTLVQGELMVNDATGDSSQRLVTYGKSVAADFAGQIAIRLTPNAGSDGVSLGGIGLAEAVPAPVGIDGDYNANGQVEQGDLDLVLLNWGVDGTIAPSGWIHDLPEGIIDQAELDKVLLNWGNANVSPPPLPLPAPILLHPDLRDFVTDENANSLAGDANRDGEVNFGDFLVLSKNFGNTNAVWEDGDFDLDGSVSFHDFLLLSQNHGKRRANDSQSL